MSAICVPATQTGRWWRPSAALFALALASCAGQSASVPDALVLHKVRYPDIAAWSAEDPRPALAAFSRSCARWKQFPPKDYSIGGTISVSRESWSPICRSLAAHPVSDAVSARRFIESHFTPYMATSPAKNDAFLTGYYAPELRGSLTPDARCRVPLYLLPPEPLTPGPTRADIYNGVLSGRGLELAYVEDPVELFFLQVQGSGALRLPDGRLYPVRFAGKTGHPYTAIGKILADEEGVERSTLSMQVIKDWLRAHPSRAQEIMQRNVSYVFFRQGGVTGAQGVELTPGRSLAVDPAYIPYGIPVFVETRLGDGSPFAQLLVAQDTGSAIKGPLRGDIYFGSDTRAETLAGHQKSTGRFVLFLPAGGGK